jgi:hypothetical protein
MEGIKVSWKCIPVLRPSSNWHARLVQIQEGVAKSWDFNHGDGVGQYDAAATFSDTCKALTFDAANNGHFFTPPAALTDGEHIFQFVDAAVPAVTDEWKAKLFRWNKAAKTITWIGDL